MIVYCKSDVLALAVQGHPRSLILVPIESAYATSYKSLIVTLVPSCTVSEILRVVFCAHDHTPIPPYLRGVPVGPDRPIRSLCLCKTYIYMLLIKTWCNYSKVNYQCFMDDVITSVSLSGLVASTDSDAAGWLQCRQL